MIYAVPEGSSTLLIMTDEEVTSESLRPWASGTQQIFTNGSFPAEPQEAADLPDRVRLAPAFCVLPAFGRLLIS